MLNLQVVHEFVAADVQWRRSEVNLAGLAYYLHRYNILIKE